MQVRKQQLELYMENDWFKTAEGVQQGCTLPPCLFNAYAEFIVKTPELQAGSDTARRNTNNLRYAGDNTDGRKREELKSLLRVKRRMKSQASNSISKKKLRSRHPAPTLHGK